MSESQKFLNKATLFMVIDNVSKILDPILKLSCAKYFIGGAWGSFVYLESLVLILLRLSLFGLDKGVIWYYGQLQSDQEYVRFFSKALIFVAIIGCILSFLGILLPDQFFSFSNSQTITIPLLEKIFFFAAIPFHGMTLLCIQALISKQNLAVGVLVRNVIQPLFTYGLPLLGILFFPEVLKLSYCYFMAVFLGFCYSFSIFLRTFSDHLTAWSLIPNPHKEVLHYSIPLSINEIINTLFIRIDSVLLLQFVGIKGVEVYSIALLISKSVLAVRESFDNILLSIFSKKEGLFLSQEKKKALNYASWMVLSIQIPIFFVFYGLGESIIQMWEPKYLPALNVILILSALFILSVPGVNASNLLIGLGKTKTFVMLTVLYFGTLFVLNFTLIPNWGAVGAALAIGITSLSNSLIALFITQKLVKQPLFEWEFFKYLGYSSLLFLPLAIVKWSFPQNQTQIIILLIISLIPQYFIIQKGLRFWNPKKSNF